MRPPLLVLILMFGGACASSSDPVGGWSVTGNFGPTEPFGFACFFADGSAAVGNSVASFEDQAALGPCCEWSEDGSFTGRLDGRWTIERRDLEIVYPDCDGPGCTTAYVRDGGLDCASIRR